MTAPRSAPQVPTERAQRAKSVSREDTRHHPPRGSWWAYADEQAPRCPTYCRKREEAAEAILAMLRKSRTGRLFKGIPGESGHTELVVAGALLLLARRGLVFRAEDLRWKAR